MSSACAQRNILRYADGVVIRVDLQPVIAQGGVFSPLADPAVFAPLRGVAAGFRATPGVVVPDGDFPVPEAS